MSDLIIKKKLRDIAEDINGERPNDRSLNGILEAIETGAGITYDPYPKTLKGRLRELGLQLNGVRPTQKALRNIVDNIVENYEGGGGGGSAKIYGVSGLYNETPRLTRTDDAVGMSFTINLDGSVTSDFDDVFPFNEMERVEITSTTGYKNIFVKVPSMWFRVGTDENQNITDIAVSKEKGKKGNWYQTKEFYYGAYLGNVSSSKMYSKSGVKCTNGKAASTYNQAAISMGGGNSSGYGIADITQRTILNFLFLIEFAHKDSQATFPLDKSTSQTTFTNGELDSFESATAMTTYRMKWRNIEDFVGQLIEFVKNNYMVSTNDYGLSYKPSENLTATSKTIKSLGWDYDYPFKCYPKEIKSEFTDDYFGNSVNYYNATTSTLAFISIGEAFSTRGTQEGAFRYYMISAANDTYMPGTVGARVVYSPNGL